MRKDILIIKLGALGDVVMATGLIRQIRLRHEKCKHSLITSPAYAGLFSAWPGLEVKAYDRKSPLATLSVINWIRQKKFRRVYDLQSNDRTRIICSLSGVPERAGNHPHYPYNLHPGTRYTGQCHIHDRMLEILTAAGITVSAADPYLAPTQTDRDMVSSWLKQQGLLHKKLAIMHAGTSGRRQEKRWPYFSDLAVCLKAREYLTIWTGGEDDIKQNSRLAQTAGVNAAGVFSLAGLVALTAHAEFAVTNDSGPMHALACGDIPVYGLFGPTNWRRNHAVGQQDHVLSLNRREPDFRATDLADLDVDHVIRQLEQDGVL